MEKENDNQQKGVYHKSVHGGKWVLFGNVLQKIINIAPFLILARLLLPKDYGVIAIIFMFTNVLSRFATPGFGAALLQREGDIEEYINVVWTYDLIKSMAIALIIFFLGGWGADFFHVAPEYVMIVKLSGVLPLITSLSNPRQMYFFKNLEFKKIFIRDLIGQIVYVVVALVIALFISATAWALFFGYIALYISGAIITYILHPSIPKLSFKFFKLRDLMDYGKWIYGQQILDYLLGFLDNILVGRMLGQTELGLYSRARDLPTTVSYPLLNIINKISFSAYAKLQNEINKIQEGFLKSLDLLLLVTIPFSLLFLVEGGSIVTLILGSKWIAIILPLKILAAANIFSSLVAMQRPIFNAIGHPEINVYVNIVQIAVFSVSIYLGIHYRGLPGGAMAVMLGWMIVLAYVIIRLRPILRIGWQRLWPIIISSGAASIVLLVLAIIGRVYFYQYLGGFMILFWAAFLGCLYLFVALFASKKMGAGSWFTVYAILNEIGIFKFIKRLKPDDISEI